MGNIYDIAEESTNDVQSFRHSTLKEKVEAGKQIFILLNKKKGKTRYPPKKVLLQIKLLLIYHKTPEEKKDFYSGQTDQGVDYHQIKGSKSKIAEQMLHSLSQIVNYQNVQIHTYFEDAQPFKSAIKTPLLIKNLVLIDVNLGDSHCEMLFEHLPKLVALDIRYNPRVTSAALKPLYKIESLVCVLIGDDKMKKDQKQGIIDKLFDIRCQEQQENQGKLALQIVYLSMEISFPNLRRIISPPTQRNKQQNSTLFDSSGSDEEYIKTLRILKVDKLIGTKKDQEDYSWFEKWAHKELQNKVELIVDHKQIILEEGMAMKRTY